MALQQPIRAVDEYLKFVEKHFNAESGEFKDIIKALDYYSQELRSTVEIRREALKLKDTSRNIEILRDDNKYKKFDKLASYGLDRVDAVYAVSDEIIQDIGKARDWLKSYKQFIEQQRESDNEDNHEQLLKLGQSILGRAVELAPMQTGFLRSSAVLIDFGTYVTIAFTAPYATYVHENLAIAHPHHPRNPDCSGRAKFLEIAVQEFFPDRRVWVETHEYSGVEVSIGINPDFVEYKHYN